MTPTFIGFVQLLVGAILLLRGSVASMLMFVMISGLMGGSAAIQMTALGNSTIPPIQFALPFLVLRLLLPGGTQASAIAVALRVNVFLIIFAVYGVASAFVGSRIFAGDMLVPPLRADLRSLFDADSLRPTPQNITTAVYLVGTLLLAVMSSLACASRPLHRTLVWGAVIVASCDRCGDRPVSRREMSGLMWASLLPGRFSQCSSRLVCRLLPRIRGRISRYSRVRRWGFVARCGKIRFAPTAPRIFEGRAQSRTNGGLSHNRQTAYCAVQHFV
jgi:hypothetical protein